MIRLLLLVKPALVILCLAACNPTPKTSPIVAELDYKKGQYFFSQQKRDSAFYCFNNVVVNSRDSLEIAMSYTYMAIIQSDAGDYFGSQESLISSLNLLDERKAYDHPYLFSNYNELGINNANLKNYSKAIEYYNQALKFAKNDSLKLIVLSHKAVAYQKMGEYAKALVINQPLLEQSKNRKRRYARILSNMAKTKWLNDSNYNAAPELHEALQIRENENDTWGLNASYAHLSDYYTQSKPDSALMYATKMYSIAKQLNSPDDEAEALQKLISISPPEAAKKYFARYQLLNDSLQVARNNAKNQFALIRYETEKHKSQSLLLQKENAEKKVRIVIQQVILLGLALVSIAVLLWYRKQKQQALREQQLKTSQKVHDVVANGLYRIMTKMEHQPEIEKQQLLDDMEILYEQSRDISYETTEDTKQNFNNEIAELLKSFSTEHTSISIVGNTRDIWEHLNEKARIELKRALQELMVNMKKHSGAKNVVVRFDKAEKGLNIRYTDDGKGVPADALYGNGLRNTENRINSIGGQFTFNHPLAAGLNIQIFIPIS